MFGHGKRLLFGRLISFEVNVLSKRRCEAAARSCRWYRKQWSAVSGVALEIGDRLLQHGLHGRPDSSLISAASARTAEDDKSSCSYDTRDLRADRNGHGILPCRRRI